MAPPTERKVIHLQKIIRTETWNTKAGRVAKAVARNTDGTFDGSTNQTAAVKAAKVVRPRVRLVGAK